MLFMLLSPNLKRSTRSEAWVAGGARCRPSLPRVLVFVAALPRCSLMLRILLYESTVISIYPRRQDVKHEIKRDPRGNTTVTDLTMESVDPNDGAGVDEIMQVCA